MRIESYGRVLVISDTHSAWSIGFGVILTPMALHCCCSTSVTWTQSWWSAATCISKLSSVPAFSRTPEALFFQPAASSIDSAFALSNGYFGVVLALYAQLDFQIIESGTTSVFR